MRRSDGRMPLHPWLVLALGLLGWMSAASQVAAQGEHSSDVRFLTGLRDRGLFELAETYCRQRLEEPNLPESQRAEMVVELSRTLAERAVNSPPDQRQPLWQQARQAAADFARQYPESAHLPLVRLQEALGMLACGELARRESQVVADRQPLVELAKTQLREAIRQLEALNEQVEQELRERNTAARSASRRNSPDRMPVDQLASLQNHVQYQLARGLRNQAECYPADSPDHANSLTQAIRLLKPLASLDSSHPLAWKSRLDLIVCYRLLDDFPTARRLIEAVFQMQPPAAVVLRGRAEQVRVALAAGQLQEALSVLAQGRELEGAVSPDLDCARLEAYLAAWRSASQAKDTAQASQWQTKAAAVVQLIERSHSPYWVRHAQMLLASYVQASSGDADLSLLVRAAENAFRSGQLDEALAAYDRARALAEKTGEQDRAFELGYVAATIAHQRNQHEDALTRYRQTALAFPRQAKAPEAHALAIYHAAQLAKAETPEVLERYLAMLEEHLRLWPSASDANDVRRRLGRLRKLRRDWAGAIAAYRTVSRDDPQFLAVLKDLEECTEAWIAERKAAGASTEAAAQEAANWFETAALDPQGRVPEHWSEPARQAILAAARIRLTYAPSSSSQAERVLRTALSSASDAPAAWRSTAQSLLILALASQHRFRDAAELLSQIASDPSSPLPEVLEGLTRMATTAEPRTRAELAALQLRAMEMLQSRRQSLSLDKLRILERCHAQALADAGRVDEALAAYQALSKAYPREGAIQEAYAQLLSTRQDRASLQASLAKWQEIAQKAEQATPRWFRAEYAMASLNYRLGKRDMTVAIIKRLKALYPDMGGPEMKAQLLELLQRCQ